MLAIMFALSVVPRLGELQPARLHRAAHLRSFAAQVI